MTEQISCKKKFGINVCSFRSDKAIFGESPESPVDVEVFTAERCPYCAPTVERVHKMLSPLKEMIRVNIINDKNQAAEKGVQVFPTVKIGDTKIAGVPEGDMLWTAVLNASINS